MNYEVFITKEAEVELGIAECFFKTKNIHHEFLADFYKQLSFIETTPFSFQKKYKEIRIVLFDDFNYSIHYLIKKNQVFILRILNQKQNF